MKILSALKLRPPTVRLPGESRADFRARRRANHEADMRAWDGITLRQAQYRAYLKTRHWQWFSLDIIDKRGAKCERCGSPERIEVHHLTYERLHHELPSDVIVLCRKCHAGIHGKPVGCSCG
jgi:hypothetical protein